MSFEYYEKCVRSCADLRAMSHVETTKPCVCSGLVGLFSSSRSEALVKKPLGKFFSFSHVSVYKNGIFEREPVSNI